MPNVECVYYVAMHIDAVPNRGSRPTYLLRESVREGAKVQKRTLANLSSLSDEQIIGMKAVLKGEKLGALTDRFTIVRSRAAGHVDAVRIAMDRLGLASVLASRSSPERDLVCAMIAARIIAPQTKLATTRWWHTTTIPDAFGVADATEDELYAAMDWLLARQGRIQKKLAARHLTEGGLVLYDLSSSYMEGTHCPLAKRGYSRDGKRGSLQVNYGVVTDVRGCPVAVSVHEGNAADSTTFQPIVEQVRHDFGIRHVVMVGDRGMISGKAIDEMRKNDEVDWVTALRNASIRSLVEHGHLQLDLFDETNILELTSPEYPGERLVACRNLPLAKRRARKREDLLSATERALEKIAERVRAGRLTGQDTIGLAAGRCINQHKMAKHFALTMNDRAFTFARKTESIATEAALDGLYIIRTSLKESEMDAAQCVRTYKSLANVERVFRTLKSDDLQVRPIHHRLADRVRAYIFLCVLAYYVGWHMREAWRELMFADTDQEAKATRDPVAPAKRSRSATTKASRRTLDDGTPAHSFPTLLAQLGTIVSNTCRTPSASDETPTFAVQTTPNAKQQHALDLIQQITL